MIDNTDMKNEQSAIDAMNEEFWNELCGSTLAEKLGIYNDKSLESLKKFDDFYFDYYPYLLDHVNLDEIRGCDVMEVGLGYGSLSQKLAGCSKAYTGMDISTGPVGMANYRMEKNGLNGLAIKSSILSNEIESESKDYVISIGCYHHTGDVEKCINETYRILRPGGIALIMVYNQFSYRQWIKWPLNTLFRLLGNTRISQIDQKWSYDHNISGEAAPETVFLSVKELRYLFSKYSKTNFTKENLNISHSKLRKIGLKTIGRMCGLDIYIRAQK